MGLIPVMPTGGITLDNVGEFIKNGTCAVGVGRALIDYKIISEARFEKITEGAKKFLALIKEARNAIR